MQKLMPRILDPAAEQAELSNGFENRLWFEKLEAMKMLR
jgi:hypothetical protein